MKVLTLEEFNKIPDGPFRATVTDELDSYLDSSLKGKEVMFVAVKGGVDWSVYFKPIDAKGFYSLDSKWSLADCIRDVSRNGDKTTIEAVIRNIVPCDDEVFKLYRL